MDFSYQGIGVVLPTTQKSARPHHLERFSSQYPPLNYNIHVTTPTGTSFLVYYNFTLFLNPSHGNFDFNVMFNIYRILLLSLKKLGGI